ncbi:MAG: hypothetical protein AABZ32_12805 [Bacteroidota bacterium]
MEKEAETKKKDAETYSANAKELQSEADSLKNNASLTSSVMKEIKGEEAVAGGSGSSLTSQNSHLTSPYVDVFVNKMHEAEKKPKELDKEESLAVIYQSWTDSLDNQISILRKQLPSIPKEEDKKLIQNKIYELQSSVEDKRQRASDSRSKVDNLKLQEALAATGAIPIDNRTTEDSTNIDSPTATQSSPENLQGIDNINNYYENKLKESSTETNEYAKKEKEAAIYTDWASLLYDESQRLKTEGKEGKAEKAEKESKAKQTLAMQTADEVTLLKAEHPDWVEEAKIKQQEAAAEGREQITTTSSETKTETSTTETTAGAATESAIQSTTNLALSTVPPESVKNKDEFTHYVALKNESDWLKKNADRQYKQADEYRKLSEEQLKESQQIVLQITMSSDPNEKQNLRQQADSMDRNALRNQAKADSIKDIAQNSQAESDSKRTESELYLQSLDKIVYQEIASATGYKPSAETKTDNPPPDSYPDSVSSTSAVTPPRESTIVFAPEPINTVSPIITETASSSTKTETTTQTENTFPPPQPVSSSIPSSSEMLKYYDAIFDRLEFAGATYSSSKPIPVDAPMPEGLIFKVQIGAFRNPIPQDLFKGLAPLTAETTPQGFKRYTAGLFQKFMTANDAKNQVKGLGYRDAFVVAFFNGKRIPVNDALAKAKEAGEDITAAVSSGSDANSTIQQFNNSIISIANTTDVKFVSGLFYAIQIGVFSKPVTSTQLYNISPLNSEKTDNGLIRYTTGRFDDEAKASRAKNNIADKGISDAFVVAYDNGKRISLSDAKNRIDSQGKDILSKDKQEYSFVPSDTTTSESSATSLTSSANLKIVFKVQIGAFRELVPIALANKFLSIAMQGIKTYMDETGLMIYTVGEFLEYESANNLKTRLVNDGLTDAFIIAFQDGKKMSAADALDMIKNR